MFTLTIKELVARKLRLLATAFAVILGVGFMAGTLVFTDTIGATFDSALAEANNGVDAYVRTPSAIDVGYGEPGPRLDASLAQTITGIKGVDEVALRINGYAQLVGRDGKPVGDLSKNPAFGTNWVTVDALNPYQLVAGHEPVNDDDIVIDKASADKAGYEPGDVATVLTKSAPQRFSIVGIAKFGSSDSPAGATAVLFTDTAATKLLATPGLADAIAVTSLSGVSQTDLVAALQAGVGPHVEVITGAALIAEDQASMDGLLAPIRAIILIFGFVAVLVGAFVINNTFSITVAQRTRQLAILRALGASGRQVRRAIVLEAVIVGALASAAGLAVGIGVAAGLRQMMSALGFDMPNGATAIEPKAMILAFGIGLSVTVLSAWLPARRAAKIAPIAALRELSVDHSAWSRRRAVIGAAIIGAGVASVVSGQSNLVAAGILTTFAGVIVVAPVLARPVARIFGLPLRIRGLSGELATKNAMRNPKRTASTAASLIIGVALVVFMTVFAASTKTSLSGSIDREFKGTHIVQTGGTDTSSGLSPQLAAELRTTPGVDEVSESRMIPAVIDNETTDPLYGFDGATVEDMIAFDSVTGDLDSLGPDGIAVSEKYAADRGWTIGTVVPATFPIGNTTFVVKAIYTGGTDWVGQVFIDLAATRANGGENIDYQIYVSGDQTAIEKVAAAYPSAEVLDKHEFLAVVSTDIDTMLAMFYALLMLAVIIALLGIANTLALSIVERTRELGVLRAVGMGRAQVRSTVRWESIIIALFGTTLGLAIGTFFG